MEHKLTSDEIFALRTIDQRNAELRARNAERLATAKAALGTKYVLHPDNAPKRQGYKAVLSHAQD